MRKLSAGSALGRDLRYYRKTKRFTQAQLASAVGLAERTIRLMEQGRGNLESFRAVLAHLDLELTGRNLPAGASLGERLATLRRHRGLTQRDLAELIGATQPTVVALGVPIATEQKTTIFTETDVQKVVTVGPKGGAPITVAAGRC